MSQELYYCPNCKIILNFSHSFCPNCKKSGMVKYPPFILIKPVLFKEEKEKMLFAEMTAKPIIEVL